MSKRKRDHRVATPLGAIRAKDITLDISNYKGAYNKTIMQPCIDGHPVSFQIPNSATLSGLVNSTTGINTKHTKNSTNYLLFINVQSQELFREIQQLDIIISNIGREQLSKKYSTHGVKLMYNPFCKPARHSPPQIKIKIDLNTLLYEVTEQHASSISFRRIDSGVNFENMFSIAERPLMIQARLTPIWAMDMDGTRSNSGKDKGGNLSPSSKCQKMICYGSTIIATKVLIFPSYPVSYTWETLNIKLPFEQDEYHSESESSFEYEDLDFE